MPQIRVVSHAQLAEVYAHSLSAGRAVAAAQFERTATELAGDDATLQRVLLARLHDAYRLGQCHEHDAVHAEFRARYRV